MIGRNPEQKNAANIQVKRRWRRVCLV